MTATKKIVLLTSDAKWIQHYLENDYPIINRGKKTDYWQTIMPSKALEEAGAIFNHYNGTVLKKIYNDRIEIIEFASPKPNQSPLEFCINKDLLNEFLAYFKDKAKNELITVEKNPFYLPKDKFLKLENSDQSYNNFCEAIKTKRLALTFKSKNVVLTKREFEVLGILAKGKRIGEAAKTLDIPPRTVESYLHKLKTKTNSYTTSCLLECFSNSLF